MLKIIAKEKKMCVQVSQQTVKYEGKRLRETGLCLDFNHPPTTHTFGISIFNVALDKSITHLI